MTLVEDVRAFNTYQNDPNKSDPVSAHNSTTVNHDYVPYVPSSLRSVRVPVDA